MLGLPSVGVIIPTRNAGRFLPEAIGSLLDQKYPRLEIILVDDNSTDNTPKLATAWATNVRYVRSEYGSPAAARNTGLRLCQTDYIGFLDADDLWSPNRLTAQIAFHAQYPDLDFSQGYTRKVFLDSYLDTRPRFPRDDAAHLNPNPGSMLFRRQAMSRLGGFDESLIYGEDIDFWLRCRASGLNGAVFEQVVLLYRMHAGNMTNFQPGGQRELQTVLRKSILRQGHRPQFSPSNARLPHIADKYRRFPLVSVVVFAPGRASHLNETLDSIENQGYPDLEIVLAVDQTSDNRKTDDHLLAHRKWRSILVHSDGLGFAQALNLGWQAASGEYLTSIKAGDLWSADRLRTQVGVLLFNAQAGLVLGDIRLVIDPLWLDPAGANQYTILPGDYLGAALFRRHAVDLVGDVDPTFEEGAAAEWLSRFASGSARQRYPVIAHIPRVVLYQRAENRSRFDVREWSQTNLTHILHRAIQRRREQAS
jgi:glycosyltransferase involved in cell wall biosynthesis